MNRIGNAAQAAPTDSGLRCPACEYNLTGVAEDRCPECGEAFDPEHLRAILAGAPSPIPIWDDPGQQLVVRFVKMCLLAWFAPTRLARMLPRRCSQASARRFRWSVFLLAFVVGGVPVMIWMGSLIEAAVVLSACAVGMIGTVMFESILDRLLDEDLYKPVDSFSNCPEMNSDGRAVFFSSFVLLYALGIGFSLAGELLPPSGFALSSRDAIMMPIMLITPWWCVCLYAGLIVQGSLSVWAKIGTGLLIPFAAGLAVLLALLIVAPLLFVLVFVLSAVPRLLGG